MLAMSPFARVMRAIDHWEAASEGAPADGVAVRLRHALVVRGVHYRYPEPEDLPTHPDPAHEVPLARPSALHDATLTIGAGITTAVVGPSGAGKSTLADVVLGLLFPHGGRVEIDGVELTPARAQAWRQRVGYVAQETYLFNDTIRANLLWPRPDASEAEMRAALVQAAAAGFVDSLPDGLDTVVGERGRSVSCGERQRLALARALLRRPELLVLDEATSSVDPENEREIQRAVESLKGRMTILVITHRLATTRAADVIHVMDRGRIVEIGTFDSLLRRGGRFAALCRAQGVGPASDPRTASAFTASREDEHRQHVVRVAEAIKPVAPDLLPVGTGSPSGVHNE
jgi:ATP-binding cassette subfamily C protein